MVTKRTGQLLHLDHDKVILLNELAKETRVPKAVLMREAIDDLLVKHGKLTPLQAAGAVTSNVIKFKAKGMLAADRVFDPLARELGFADSDDMVEQHEVLKTLKRTKKSKRVKRKPTRK